jgi:hypothetical protein
VEDKEAVEMMQRCLSDIENLRRQIGHLEPQAEAYTVIRDVVRLLPKASQGYGEDICWILRKKIAELQPKPKAP